MKHAVPAILLVALLVAPGSANAHDHDAPMKIHAPCHGDADREHEDEDGDGDPEWVVTVKAVCDDPTP